MTDNLEIKRQELARQLVVREVYYCVSSLMDSVGNNLEDCARIFDADYDELLNLYSRYDYEEAGREALSDADLDTLEEVADQFGYWDDVLAECDIPEVVEGEDTFTVCGKTFDYEDDAIEVARMSKIDAIREKVADIVDDWQRVCNRFDLDLDPTEVYEYWIVSSWLYKRLEERGECVGEFAGMSIWGRTCTGQAIYLDGVIREIAAALYGDKWNREEIAA